MPRSALIRESIFDNIEQVMDNITPSEIGLIGDRVLIQDLPDDDERIGSIVLPEVSRNNEKIRQGIIVACGPGDSCVERVIDRNAVDHEGRPYLRRTRVEICKCGHDRSLHVIFRVAGFDNPYPCDAADCECNDFDGRLPMHTKPGDRVLYTRRRDEEIYVNGVRYSLVHEGQAVLGVIE
jgi:co-chaperonin GroES (HSP10)